MKKVILMTSTYNGAKYLPALLESILAQTYPCIDMVIRDDGSTDDTVSIIREYQKNFSNGKRIILFNDLTNDWTNKGAHQSYHLLIQNLEKADYYMGCDQDDVWLPTKVEHAVNLMSQYPDDVPVLYCHNYYLCDGDLNICGTIPGRKSISPKEMKQIDLAKVIMAGTWAGVGMAQAFNHTLKQLTYHTGDFEPSIALDCWVSWVVAGTGGALIYDDEPLAYYRRHNTTFSSGDAVGFKRYLDWKKHMNRHCANITNGIHDFLKLYASFVNEKSLAFLQLFDSRHRFRKFFYPHRLRGFFVHEIAFRILILFGKI